MAANLRLIVDSIRTIAGSKNNTRYYDVVIIDQNPETQTVSVESVDNDAYFQADGVRYMSDISDGNEELPSIGSSCIMITKDNGSPFIVKNSYLDKKEIIVGDQSFLIVNGKQTFNDGSYGGLEKIIDPSDSNAGTLARFNKIENKLNDFIEKWNSFCSSYAPGSPSSTGTPATLSTSTETEVTLTQRSDIENPLIIHGK